ncbi:MAG: magnesium transporter [Opitutales bacterium]|nr:magnesium transporter [Opitutales bacterium]
MDPQQDPVQNIGTDVPPMPANDAEPRPFTPDELLDYPRDQLGEMDSERLGATSPVTLALFLERLDVDDRRAVLRRITIERAAEVLAEMHGEAAAEVLEAMRERRAIRILEDFEPDDAADIMAELGEEDRARLLGKLNIDTARTVKDLLSYGPDTAGGAMNPDVDTIRDDMSVDEAVAHIRELAEEREDMHYLYVVDSGHRLVGVVSLRRLIQAKPQHIIRDVMDDELIGLVLPDDDREKVALTMAECNLPDLPVVDRDGVLLGVITHDDVIDIMQEEATEDFQVMSGAGGDEGIHDHVMYSVRKRMPWLQFNLGTAFIAANVVLLFQSQIGRMPILAGLMPVVAGIGGNCGQQTLAVTIRSLALGEIHDADTWGVFFKQLAIGVINGLAVGLVASLLVFLFTQNLKLAGVLMAATVCNMALGGMTGAAIPLVMRKLKMDPAQCSSIVLTAVTDTGGFFIFLSLGTIFLLS